MTAAMQDHEIVRKLAADFLYHQAKAQTGETTITMGQVDKRLNLAACQSPVAFLPSGSKAWGKITVGVRCTAPVNWVIYLQANVQITSEYYVASRTLSQGQLVVPDDMSKIKGDISNLPAGIVTNPEQVLGKSLQSSVSSGTPLRVDLFRSPAVVQQGQSVRVVSNGPGFQVATDAQALNNAAEGQVAKARTSNGQTISGIAKAGGIIEITY
ncbi:flagellar basal body P-ring formation chaperone FlgA [Undibacterium sp. WLX3042]|uniref:flagellar basal body P-ring formation chaperone FlgA n=1 Tax=Undibacterium sp. WLX3042 TaxID=3412686 RepID=UPI003C307737